MYLYDRGFRGHCAPQALHGLGWTLPDVATRQAQVDAIVLPGARGHCRVDPDPRLTPIRGRLHIEIGGEGRYPGAYNLNPTSKGTVAPWANKDIPNHVCGVGESIPVPSGTVDYITLESVRMSSPMIAEIARVIKKTGHVRLITPKDPGDRRWHTQAANAIGLPYPAGLPEEITVSGVPVYVSRIGTHWDEVPLGFLPPYVPYYTVGPGDWLSTIAQRVLGDLRRWPEIYKLNRGVIGTDANLIQVGQELRLPPA